MSKTLFLKQRLVFRDSKLLYVKIYQEHTTYPNESLNTVSSHYLKTNHISFSAVRSQQALKSGVLMF